MITQNHSAHSIDSETPRHTVSQVVNEVLTLAELQVELARSDAREAMARVMNPVATFAVAAVMGAAGFLIILIALSEGLVALGLPKAAGYGVVGILAMAISSAVAMAAWKWLHAGPPAFYRSREEVARNVAWFRSVTQDFSERAAHSSMPPH